MLRSLSLVSLLLALCIAPVVHAASGIVPGYHFEADISNASSLQRGARIFVNYCMGCHSAAYMRYNRLGKDLGITEEVLMQNFIFAGGGKPGNTMNSAMKPADALAFFGVAPPDLSVIARSRGPDWLYAYMMTFYVDPSRPFGVNNQQFKDVAMPHVLWDLQGLQQPVFKTVTHEDGTETQVIDHLEQLSPGKLSPDEYKKTVQDLVNFLVYLSEPAKFQRHKVGIWAIIYLLCFLVIALLLKREYWKDVH